jgi:hypothetical protein
MGAAMRYSEGIKVRNKGESKNEKGYEKAE